MDIKAESSSSSIQLNGLRIDRVATPLGGVELRVCPESKSNELVARRESITGRPECQSGKPTVVKPDSIVQVKLAQDAMDFGFLEGVTMQDSATTRSLRLDTATSELDDNGCLVTRLKNEDSGLMVTHYMEVPPVPGTLRMWSTVTNISDSPVELEHLSSFVLSGMSPFVDDDAAGRLRLHRFRSWWSNEGKHEDELLETLHLVRNWQGNLMSNERFGQVGTQPVRKYFPFVAIE
ncbi:MAG: hypothetical protein ACQKBW_10765, partial [Puniceicoccales bacterium]